MAAKPKSTAKAAGSVRPTRVTQVNQFLREHGIKDVGLERGHGYFSFWGMPIHAWLNRIVMAERLDTLTLNQWLEKYRELEKQNKSDPLGAKKTKARRRKK